MFILVSMSGVFLIGNLHRSVSCWTLFNVDVLYTKSEDKKQHFRLYTLNEFRKYLFGWRCILRAVKNNLVNFVRLILTLMINQHPGELTTLKSWTINRDF